jgi:uncharacterized BrkB/YihY/UPF0761 family membrane protein
MRSIIFAISLPLDRGSQMHDIMIFLWSVVELAFWYIPWIAMGAVAAWVYFRRKPARPMPLLLEIGGAAGYVVLAPVRWLILLILSKLSTPPSVFDAVVTIFSFLTYVCFLAFAIGFCLEKWIAYRAQKVTVVGVVVDEKKPEEKKS